MDARRQRREIHDPSRATGVVHAVCFRRRRARRVQQDRHYDRTRRQAGRSGLAHLGAGDLLESRRSHSESLELARTLGHERSIANSLSNIADIEATLGNHDEAEALARESLEINRRIGDEAGAGVALLLLAVSTLERGSEEAAVPMIVESVRCFRSVDFKDYLASALVALARAEAPSHPPSAALLLGAARTIRAELGRSQFPWEQAWFETTLERVRAELGDERTEGAVSEGSAFPERTIDDALALST